MDVLIFHHILVVALLVRASHYRMGVNIFISKGTN